METSDKGFYNKMIRERTLVMAIKVHDLIVSKKVDYINRSIIIQLIRSSSSVAANYRAATRGRSDAEFYSKVCIALEECDETQFWIDYLTRLNVLNPLETQDLLDEIEQLIRIFSAIKRKMKEKLRK